MCRTDGVAVRIDGAVHHTLRHLSLLLHRHHYGHRRLGIQVKHFYKVLYVQEVVTLQKKYLIYFHQKMRFTPFINYYNTLG